MKELKAFAITFAVALIIMIAVVNIR